MAKTRPEPPAIRYRQLLRPERGGLVSAGNLIDKRGECIGRNWDRYALVYLLEGGGVYRDDRNGERTVKAGDVLVLFPGLRHSYYRKDHPIWSECFIVFQGRIFEQLEADGLLRRGEPVLSPGLVPALTSAFDTMIRDFLGDTPEPDALAVARVHLLLAEIDTHHRRMHSGGEGAGAFLKRACALLERGLERGIDLPAVAASFHLSYERFRKRFAEESGTSPAQYRSLRRIDRAKALLAVERLPVKEVAERLGYCDVYYFARQFKQVTGQTPAQFRRVV